MANAEHLAILKQGVVPWNEWRLKNPETRPDLTSADLEGINLGDANLFGVRLSCSNLSKADLTTANLFSASLIEARLTNADLRGADLRRADLFSANFSQANLQSADLSAANLYRTNLSGANLNQAYLIAVNLTGADLSKADLSHAYVRSTTFADLDLSKTRGLATVAHWGNSTIGIDTVYRSQGRIPKSFLLGCGVPSDSPILDTSIARRKSRFFSCFVSHSSKDKYFCEHLCADLQINGVRRWYFPEDAKWGQPLWREIDRNIHLYDKLIVVCSKNSLTSGPVLREIERALNREDKEGKNILFPITIDRYIFDEWDHPRKDDVLQKVVGTDFVGWNRDAAKYDKAFKKLLKALKAG